MALEISLAGKVALVTGAGNGIGKACANALAAAGAYVWINDVDQEAAGQTALEMDGSAVVADVADPGAIKRMAETIQAKSGRLDLLINNAGFDYDHPFPSLPLSEWTNVHNVHLRGMFLVAQACNSLMAHGSAIVNIASVHASMTEPGFAAYASAKAGIVGMTRAMAIDLGPKIRVNAISPGYVHTRLITQWLESTPDPAQTLQKTIRLHPMARLGRPEDIAHMAVFLCSDLSSFVTGQNFTVDGGLTAGLPRADYE
ncbi:MAG TPA: SDR family oxidoreductase [Fimbriimonas sp.]|nr:SDR family oxidoreductase [Fimbriimonas sp.]